MRITTTVPALVQDFLEAQDAANQANERLSKAKNALITEMEVQKRKSIKWTDAGDRLNSVTFVRQTRTEIDEKGLRKALTAKVFDKYTKKVLDRKAMEDAMDKGAVDPVVVAKYVTERKTSPFLKYSVTDPKEEK